MASESWRGQLEAAAQRVANDDYVVEPVDFAVPRGDKLDELALANTFFRRILFSTQQMQIVLMNIEPDDGGIGAEVHPYTSQFFYIVDGRGVAKLDTPAGRVAITLKRGRAFAVPANTPHAILQIGEAPLKLYTIYAPPVHEPDMAPQRSAPD